METTAVPRIVVGVIDAPESELAVRWAAQHAERVGGRLHLVHAMVWGELGVNTGPVPGIADSGMAAVAEALLEDAAAIARETAPEVEVTAEAVSGNATAVLVGASAGADAIVVGGRGLGRLLTLLVGSKSLALASRAHCPVVIVRGQIEIAGSIGVVDDENTEVLDRAADLGAAYGVDVDLILGHDTDPEIARGFLEHARAVVSARHPGVEVGEVLVPTVRGARELIRAAEGTSLMVVPAPAAPDSEGRVPVTPRLSQVLRFANTPVWIERPVGS